MDLNEKLNIFAHQSEHQRDEPNQLIERYAFSVDCGFPL